jgi:hypothetical protein
MKVDDEMMMREMMMRDDEIGKIKLAMMLFKMK